MLATEVLLSENKPKIDIGGDYCRESEGNTDLEKVGVFDREPLLAEYADSRDVR